MTCPTHLPKLTVVTPSFNQGTFLESTIRSVLNQEYPNLEYVIMDGGSTDNTVGIIKKYEKYLHYWQSCKDGGQSAAVNAGFEKGTGELLTFINSDDMLLPGSLARAAEVAGQHPKASVFYGHLVFIDKNNMVMRCYFNPPVFNWILWHNRFLGQPGVFFRRIQWELVGGLDETLRYSFDTDFWYRLLQIRSRFVPLRIPTAAFRKHAGAKGLLVEWAPRMAAENAILDKRYPTTKDPALRWVARCAFYAMQFALLNYPKQYLSRIFRSYHQQLVNVAASPPRFLNP